MSEQTETKRSYKKTLNLPKTSFAMKANLVQREPQTLQRWQKLDLYGKIREARAGAPPYVFHDGPPYANGPIHLGHLLNKVLKDLIVRSRTMLGFDVPYIPGWDCHGLPIEHKVVQDLGEQARNMQPIDIRRKCKSAVEKFIKLQSQQMQRLLTLGDYAQPYITMLPQYEADEYEVLARLLEAGIVERGLKPVHWSIENRTALADAELEYEDRQDTSVFVLFEVTNPQNLPQSLGARPGFAVSLMIWTTTPWTLPANLAVAAGPGISYGLYRFEHEGRGGMVLLAEQLADHVLGRIGATYEKVGTCTGRQLEEAGIEFRHPFIDRTGRILTADYVSTEDGTGLVHTAPGHGVEDYQTGLAHGLEIYCPVLEDGTFDGSVPDWLVGKSVWQGNTAVVEHLRESGHLMLDEQFTHSYPHDWRSKTPVIFRATEQWFISVDRPFATDGKSETATLRQRALKLVDDVAFYPAWGRNRLRGMLESRPDWCISRQRSWGVPIPAFYGPESGQVLLTPASVRAAAKLVAEKGTDVWFLAEPHDLLADYNPANDPHAPDWAGDALMQKKLRKGTDTLDVWVDSGSSWNAVVRRRFGDQAFPTDLYVEGSDQHRGWFQSSLLLAVGAMGQAPYKAILTHGFMVDRHGKKMSKSGGNALAVEDLLKDFGADVCRWWVCSLNTDNDIKADLEYFRIAGEEYRKVRNTIRFLLSNLSDFDPKSHRRPLTETDATSIDAWAQGELDSLIANTHRYYQEHRYRKVHEAIFNFCNDTMSAIYLAATKDRLYCDRVDSDRRQRTQTVMYEIVDALIRLIAPVLVHTAEEAWLALHGEEDGSENSVHLQLLPEPSDAAVDEAWPLLMKLRDRALKHLEDARAQRGLDNPLDAGIEVELPSELHEKLNRFDPIDLADLHGVSRFALSEGASEVIVIQDLSNEPRCERSWKRDGTVKQRSDGGLLSNRDAEAVGLA